MASSITYKNLFFPTTGNDIGNTNGFLTYCEYTDEMVELSQGPNFKVYEHLRKDSGLKVYGVKLKRIAIRDNRPVYRIYDGYNYDDKSETGSVIRCWSFWNIWVMEDGTTYYDESDHTVEGHVRIDYVNSDWLFIANDGFIKARFTTSDGTVYEDYLRCDRCGLDAEPLYRIGTIDSGIGKTNPNDEYVCELMEFSNGEYLNYPKMLKPLSVDKNIYGFTEKIFDYAIKSTINEEFFIKYNNSANTNTYSELKYDFGYDFEVRDIENFGNDDTNLITKYEVKNLEYEDVLAQTDDYNNKMLTTDGYHVKPHYITNRKPILLFNGGKRYVPYTDYDLDDSCVVLDMHKENNDFYLGCDHYTFLPASTNKKREVNNIPLLNGLPNVIEHSSEGKAGISSSFRIAFVEKITKENASKHQGWNEHIGEYIINTSPSSRPANAGPLSWIEKRNDGFYANTNLEEYKGRDVKVVAYNGTVTYFANDPIEIGLVKHLKHILFSFIPEEVLPNFTPNILGRKDIKCIYEINDFPKYTEDQLNTYIQDIFGINDDEMKVDITPITVDKEHKIQFVVPRFPSYIKEDYYSINYNSYYCTFNESVNTPFCEYVLENYKDASVDYSNDDSTFETKFNAISKYIQDSSIKSTDGEYWTRLKDPFNPDDEKTVEEIIEETREKSASYWITPMDFYSSLQNDQLYCTDDGTGYYKYGDNGENSPNYFWVNTLKNWCTFKIDRNNNYIIACVWNGRNDWDTIDTILGYKDDPKTVARKYMYDITNIIEGPYIANFPVSQTSLNIKTQSKHKTWYGTTRHTYYENREPSSSAPFIKKSIRLYEDTKFSYHDTNTYQTIKPSKLYLNDVMKRYVWPIGCPMIERLPSGELNLIYTLALFGVENKPVITDDMIKFMNSICISYFGDGKDKTIDDWKRLRHIDYSEEVPTEEIITEDTNTLYNQDVINTNVVNNNNNTIEFKLPTEYPTTNNLTNTDYAERWER